MTWTRVQERLDIVNQSNVMQTEYGFNKKETFMSFIIWPLQPLSYDTTLLYNLQSCKNLIKNTVTLFTDTTQSKKKKKKTSVEKPINSLLTCDIKSLLSFIFYSRFMLPKLIKNTSTRFDVHCKYYKHFQFVNFKQVSTSAFSFWQTLGDVWELNLWQQFCP